MKLKTDPTSTRKQTPSRVWNVLSIVILLFSYSFLAYKLLTFNQYPELIAQWRALTWTQSGWLLGVIVLLPINWLLEALKWKKLCTNIQTIGINSAIKAVLAGISTGFFTPNRVGELVGRILFLDVENRKAGVTLSVINSLTQNIVMAACGIPASVVFFSITTGTVEANTGNYLGLLFVGLLLCAGLYFALPKISKKFTKNTIGIEIGRYTNCLSSYSTGDLLQVIAISLLRYLIFCTQLYLMLGFFGVSLQIWQAALAIPASYLFITFTPALAFSEAAVRSSYAVLFVGAFSGQVVSIALAGVCIWAINFIIPMIAGSILMVKQNAQEQDCK